MDLAAPTPTTLEVGAPPPAEAIVQGKTELGMERGSLHIQEPLLCTLS